jgi:hypothetical protein
LKRLSRHSINWFLRIIFFCVLSIGVILIVLSFVSVPVNFLKETIHAELSGFVEDINDLELSFTRHGFGLEAKSIQFKEKIVGGDIILPKTVFYFDPIALIKGQLIPNKLAFYEPSVNLNTLNLQGNVSDSFSFKEIFKLVPNLKDVFIHKLKINSEIVDLDPFDIELKRQDEILKLNVNSHFGSIYAYNLNLILDENSGKGRSELKFSNLPLALFGVSLEKPIFVSGHGSLTLDSFLPELIDLNIHDELSTLGIDLKAKYALLDHKFLLDGSRFILGFMHCPITGEIKTPYDAPKFALNMTFPKLIKSEELLAVFPSGLLRAPYLWLKEHLKTAELRDLGVLIEFSEEKGFDIKGQFNFSNLGLTYFGHLPPLQNIKGSGLFTKDIIQFDLDKGVVNKLVFGKSRATITGLTGSIQHISIDTHLSGDIKNALEVANQKPLEYLEKIGFKPSGFDGIGTYDIKLTLPLLKDVYLKDCEIEIDCVSKKITTPIEILKEKIALYDIKTKITSDKLTLSSDLLFKGQKAQFNWTEFFSPKIQNSRTLKFVGEMNQKIIDSFQVDFFKVLHSVPFTFSYVENAQTKAAKGDLDFNFRNGTLNIPQLGFIQKENQPLKGHANIDFIKGTLHKISSLSLSGEDCDIKGSILLKNGAINVVDLPKFKLNQTNCALHYAPGQLSLKGDAFYVGGIKFDTNSDKKIPDINLNLDIRNVNAQKGSMLKELKGFLTFRDNKWYMADIAAMTSTLKPIKLHIQPRQSDRVLNFSAEDIGPLCDTLDVLTFMKSGRMNINGTWNDKEKNAPLSAKITASGLKLKEAPAMLKIFSAFSVPGLMNMMSGGQVQFNDLKTDILSQNDVLHVKSLIGTGSSLNVSLNGTIDSKSNTIDLKGAIGSSGVIDKVLGFIPIIGSILTGTNKLGMFAVKFKVSGSLKDPKVSTNPLSALTPGILREMSSSTGK